MVGSIILGIVVFLLLKPLLKSFKKGKKERTEVSVIFGLGVAVVNYLAIKLPAVVAVLLIIVPLFGMFWLFRYWKEEGDTLKEGLLYFFTNAVIAIVLNNAAVRIHDLTNVRWVIAIFSSISSIAIIVMLGFMITNVVKFRMELGEFEEKEEEDDEEDDDEEERESIFKRFTEAFWF